MTTKIYLASRYSNHPYLREVRELLEKTYDCKVTSRWIDGHLDMGDAKKNSFTPEYLNANPQECAVYAEHDLQDITDADIVISFTGEGGKGGRHIEFGYAFATGKELIIIGPRENVFHTLPSVIQFESLARFLVFADQGYWALKQR
jgi:nucleoside 2-deoxyribosyltransferase